MRRVFSPAACAALSAAVVGFALAGNAAHAANIVSDTWLDADRTDPASPIHSEYGADADADGNIESAWYNGGTGATAVATAGHLMLTPSTSSASWTTHFTPEGTPIALGATGDFIKVTWTFTTGDVNATNTSQNFRAALFDSDAAARLAVDGAPGTGAFPGYALFGNMGETTGNGNSFQLRERAVATGDLLGASGNWAALGNGLGNTQTGYTDNTQYTFVMTLTRNAASGLDIAMSMTGGTIGGSGSVAVNLTDASPNSLTYDSFGLRPSNAATTASQFDTTLFQVETNVPIPEPTSLALLGLGGLTLLRRRRSA
jgi:hypothetical protein